MNRAQLQQQQPDVLDRLTQGFQMGLQKQQMDMQRRQLEAKQLDVGGLAEQAIYKAAQGIPLSPQEDAAIKAESVLKGQQTYVDPYTQQVITQPALADRAAGLLGRLTTPESVQYGVAAPIPQVEQGAPIDRITGQPVSLPDRLGDTGYGQGTNPALTMPYDQIRPKLGYDGQQLDDAAQYEMTQEPNLKVTGQLAGTNRGNLMEAESKQRVAETQAVEDVKAKVRSADLMNYDQGQLAAASFANRMKKTSEIMDGLEFGSDQARTGVAGNVAQAISVIPSFGLTDELGRVIVNRAATPEQKKYLNAADNWIRANLRKESGAAIAPDEMQSEYETYFPIAGDTPDIAQQKRALRKETEDGMIAQSAGSYQLAFGKKAQVQDAPQNTNFAPDKQKRLMELRAKRDAGVLQ